MPVEVLLIVIFLLVVSVVREMPVPLRSVSVSSPLAENEFVPSLTVLNLSELGTLAEIVVPEIVILLPAVSVTSHVWP